MRRSACIVAVVIAVASSSALAQDTVVEGAGYEISEGTVVHPRASLSTGYISNVFYEAGDEGGSGSAVIRLGLSAALASEHNRPAGAVESPLESAESLGPAARSSPSLDYRLTGRLDYTQHISGNNNVKEQNGFSSLALGIDAHLVTMPDGPLSFMVDNRFTRDVRPRNYDFHGNFNRVINRLRGGLRWRPGRGALQFSARYENTLDIFESELPGVGNRMNQLLRGRAEWQFLPITRFYLDASYGFFGPMGDSDKPTSTPLRILLGGASAITENTTLRVHAGFGKGFYSAGAGMAGAEFTGPLLGAEFGMRYRSTGRFTVAYQYDFRDALGASFYRDHAVQAKVDQQIDQILLHILADIRLRGYRGVFTGGEGTRDDFILRLGTRVHYVLRDWLALTGEIDVVSDTTSFTDAMGNDPSYNRLEIQFGAQGAL
ncbi:MAG: hypothetical protein MJE77_23580 [Proteobacteria bacterium]|nr:hypothetical protein [Pseudomonadota bacterium]